MQYVNPECLPRISLQRDTIMKILTRQRRWVARGVLAGRALPRGKLKTIHRNDTGIGNPDVSKKRIHRNSTKISNPDVFSSQNLSSSSQVYQIKQPALLHSPNSKRIAAQKQAIHRSRPQTADSDVFTYAPKSHPIEFLIPPREGA